MNYGHLHLLLNHVAIVGVIIGCLILTVGIIFKSTHIQKLAFFGFFFLGIVTFIVYKTGGPAVGMVKKIPGISKEAIHEHRDAAQFAFYGMIIVGIVSGAAFIYTMRKKTFPIVIPIVVLLLSLFVSSILIRTGLLGGQIRHTELVSDPAGGQSGGERRDKHNDSTRTP